MRYIFLLLTLILASAFGTSASAITINEAIDAPVAGDFDAIPRDIFSLSLGTNTISGTVTCLRDQLFTSDLICSSALGTDSLNADPFDIFGVLTNGLQVTSISFEVTSFESTDPNDPGFFYSVDATDSPMFLFAAEFADGILPSVGSTGNVVPPGPFPGTIAGFSFDVGTQSGAGLLTPTQTSIDWTVTIETAVIPLPAGLPLLASVLGTLMFLRRKRSN